MDRAQTKPLLLIADANAQDVDVLKKLLAPDYDISVAVSLEETLRLAGSPEAPGLILLGDMSPAADPDEVCARLNTDPTTRDIPVILLVDPTREETEASSFERGVVDCITRPFKPSVVRARVRAHLELRLYREHFEKDPKKLLSRRIEEARRTTEVEDPYRLLVENARDGIAIIHDFIVKYANPAFSKITGLSPEELIGAHLKKFMSEEEFIKNTTHYSHRISGINLPRIYRSKIIHADGYTIDVELNVCVVPYGQSLAALVFVRDIREEKAWQYLK
ncbi:MAG: PAS domain S-box protein [Deltaproteobacteria bacterium]|nr:PAS domain S-box protein [Deltaproteobacteria bacterium]